ncbi:MAG: 50S ribosomal protein L4 [Desulfobulbaceae bacterium]|nr:50S ribosomal protein L4 [Desulfobulbaceae bacterium]MCK5544217.1 50S ribosomal protein L4 [Desulfobulbaceae bacterium]
MAVTELYNIKKEKIGEIELNDSLFGETINSHILHDIVRMQLANRRAGTASTKTRSEVRGSNAKPWRQKGTGRARAGHRRSPLWRGGGTVFGPKPRSYAYKLPKKVRKLGLRMALSSRFEEGLLTVLDDFKIDEIKTRTFVDIMGVLGVTNGLIVTSAQNEQLERSSRNVPGFKVLSSNGLNVYDILLYEHIILVQSCISQLEERLLS